MWTVQLSATGRTPVKAAQRDVFQVDKLISLLLDRWIEVNHRSQPFMGSDLNTTEVSVASRVA